MFRKPKNKKSKATFRKPNSTTKTFRKRSLSEDDEKDTPTGGSTQTQEEQEPSTRDLLQQIQSENKRKRINKNNDSSSNASSSTKNVMDSLQVSSTDPSQQISAQDLATRTAEFHPKDTANQHSKNPSNTGDNDTTTTDKDGVKLYTGDHKPRNKFLAGPLKAPTFVRTTSRFDYEPNICKDYKDTGFCGFGDSCIYLHDRGDRKSGWQLDMEWEEKRKKRQEEKEQELTKFLKSASEGGVCVAVEDDEKRAGGGGGDGLPFACHLCREAFKEPIVTNCGHYFCEACILKEVREQKSQGGTANPCPICNKDTGGVFNYPTKLENKKKKVVGRGASWEEYFHAMRKNQTT